MFWSGKAPTASADSTLTSESEFFWTCSATAWLSASGRRPVMTMSLTVVSVSSALATASALAMGSACATPATVASTSERMLARRSSAARMRMDMCTPSAVATSRDFRASVGRP
jgi:hypothetical protein